MFIFIIGVSNQFCHSYGFSFSPGNESDFGEAVKAIITTGSWKNRVKVQQLLFTHLGVGGHIKKCGWKEEQSAVK